MAKRTIATLNGLVEEFLLERGAIGVGVATIETLAGGPPSTDLEYCLEGGRSAISFALPLNRDHIRAYLAKEDRLSHEKDNIDTNLRATDISWELAEMLKKEGHSSKGTKANLKYRQEMKDWELFLPPDISHRYVAARSGAGSFGWSGNVGVEGHGTAVILDTTITTAELEPTEPVPPGEGFCDECKLCTSVCASGMFDKKEETSVTIGGVTFSFSARSNYLLCDFCCGGFTGLARSGKWSTWSPGRIPFPDDYDELFREFVRAVDLYNRRPPMPGGIPHPALDGYKQHLTCGNCQITCWGNKEDTRENVKLLHNSGCVLQRPDGELYALPPEEAEAGFDNMEAERRALYF